MENELNENDKKLLALCRDVNMSAGKIAKILDIAPSSVSAKLKKLEQGGYITIARLGRGKKIQIRAVEGNNVKRFMVRMLKQVEKQKSIDEEKFGDIEVKDNEIADKIKAKNHILFSYPSFLKYKIELSQKGKEFLKQND